MSTFPSTLSIISSPNPTDRLNSPSHSSIESSQNDAVRQLEKFIGTDASAVGTLHHDVRSPDSDGGGHVQAANKGGTGQTAFTKGDILVAQSSSVLTKLAVGENDQLLQADNTEDVGMRWTDTATGRIAANHFSVNTYATTGIYSVLSVNIQGSTLGTAGAIKTIIPIKYAGPGSENVGGGSGTLDMIAQYGDSSILVTSLLTQVGTAAMGSFMGECVMDVVSASVVGSQKMIIRGRLDSRFPSTNPSSVKSFYVSSVIAEESSSTLALTVSFRGNAGTSTSTIGVVTDGFIIEKV